MQSLVFLLPADCDVAIQLIAGWVTPWYSTAIQSVISFLEGLENEVSGFEMVTSEFLKSAIWHYRIFGAQNDMRRHGSWGS